MAVITKCLRIQDLSFWGQRFGVMVFGFHDVVKVLELPLSSSRWTVSSCIPFLICVAPFVMTWKVSDHSFMLTTACSSLVSLRIHCASDKTQTLSLPQVCHWYFQVWEGEDTSYLGTTGQGCWLPFPPPHCIRHHVLWNHIRSALFWWQP